MQKLFFIVSFMFFGTNLFSQSLPTDTIRDSLLQLNKQKRITPKYVNFDVIKIMPGFGRSTDNLSGYGTGLSFKGQVLYPYSLFKNFFPIAYGVTIGYSKITRNSAEYVFSANKLKDVVENAGINSTVQRTGHIGLIGLHVIRYRSFTILAGASFDLNILGNRLKIRRDEGNTSFRNRKQINPVSIPLHLQISSSRKQFISFGIFSSYDTQLRFRGDNFNKTRQLVIGGSLAVII